MPQKAVDYDALAQQFGGTPDYDALAAKHGGSAAEPQQPSGPSRFISGTGEGLKETAQLLDPRNWLGMAKGIGGSLVEGAKAIPDVARNLLDSETRGATLRGFGEGAVEGATGVGLEAAKQDPWTAAGKFTGGVVIPALTLKAAPKALRSLKGKPPSLPARAGPYTTARPPTSGPYPAVRPTARPAPAPKATAGTMELPASWKQFVNEPPAPEVKNIPGIITKRTPKPEAVAEARRALGSVDAAPIFGISPAEVKGIAPGPSRIPLKKRIAEMDLNYQRLIDDPRGAIDPKLLRTVGLGTAGAAGGAAVADEHPVVGGLLGALAGAALANPMSTAKGIQTARVTGMLSGLAPAKSALGNVGAIGTAAAERGSLAPAREALRVPTNVKVARQAWKSQANPSGTAGFGKINIPGRLMGVGDQVTTQALQRAGLSLEDAQRLLLTKPDPLGGGGLQKAVSSPVGRFAFPFQRTPFNFVSEGIQSINEALPGSGTAASRRALLTDAAVLGGGAAGSVTDDPKILALLAALAGPRGLPFALGAGATAGPQLVERVGVGIPEGSWKDLFDPLRPIFRPALMRLLEEQGSNR